MQQTIKRILCIAGLVGLVLPSAMAFSLAGPVRNGGDVWQLQNIGYGPPTAAVAPKNIGEGYRRNIPVMYYAYTPAFLDYFGLVGATNVDYAFALLNQVLTNGVSKYSSDLSEFPDDSLQYNYAAQALQLYDIKSMVMSAMMDQLGLASPEENVWKLHDRIVPTGGKCPIDTLYTVIQRNFGIAPTPFNQIQYSSYVNNTLYTFQILEACQGTVIADTFPVPVDPLAASFTSVAGFVLRYGGYYVGLTGDDVGGLRYLMSTNAVNWETVGGGSLLFDVTTNSDVGQIQFPANPNTVTGYGTFNLGSLISFATTNAPAVVMATFPGVVVASSTHYLVLASNATVTSYFAPPSFGSAFGTPPTLVVVTNYTPYLTTNYVTTFANVITNYYTATTKAILQTVTTGPLVGAPAGTIGNITNNQTITLNIPNGSYFTVPIFGTNLCPSGILYTGLSSVFSTTNLITSANTNVATATNTTVYSYSQSIITSYTNFTYVGYQVDCGQTANATGLYQGMDKLKFIGVDYDSLLGRTFAPITNGFSLVAVTNSQTRVQHFDRVLATPDVLIDASDLATGAADHPVFGVFFDQETVPGWNAANAIPGLAGPGTINPTTTFTFNKVGDIYENGSLAVFFGTTNAFLQEQTEDQLLAYASFDGSTNDPVVYPNGSSIQNLQNQLLIQITPTSLAKGSVNVAYPGVQFATTGGSFIPTFKWSSIGPSYGSPVTTGLPPGMTLSTSGLLSGTPTQRGTYDFTLILTDSLSRSVQWSYTIIIQ